VAPPTGLGLFNPDCFGHQRELITIDHAPSAGILVLNDTYHGGAVARHFNFPKALFSINGYSVCVCLRSDCVT